MSELESVYASCEDLIIREIINSAGDKAIVVFFEGITDEERLNETIMKINSSQPSLEPASYVQRVLEVTSFSELIEKVSIGNPVMLTDGSDRGMCFVLPKVDKRAIEEPIAESVVRGPREGFTETLTVNISLLRRRLRTPLLKVKAIEIGTYTKSRVNVAYIEKLAEPELVDEVMKRLSAIQIDGVLESGNIEELIEDSHFSPFPQMLSTERPDNAIASLLEGKVVILIDGTPFVLIAPTGLFSFLHTPEDSYQRFMISMAILWLRYIFFMVALLAPSAYVAILTYHHEMIPTALLLSIAKSREEIPFPAVVEAFIMEITFEALREAGVRLPKQVGSAVSIVGALVIGQAATSAGLVSSPMVMVVAITGIASFMIPNYTMGIPIRLLRFPIMILAGVMGLLGLLMGVIAVVIHLCSLRSFGTPYLMPLVPLKNSKWKEVLLRIPLWSTDKRTQVSTFRDKGRNK
ncbi:spore germination protein [Cohnella abietis]|uniref:spore germination protein n=1 Tax=Cohnella abietis TaxID=2507935 RepID=UPI0013902BAF|nr:spore germination protein [Cohnella abietis]